jgi:hypothetical protein
VIAVSRTIQDVLDVHRVWAWVAISTNGVAGVIGLVIWRRWEWRGRWYWWVTAAAQVAMLIQVLLGVIAVSDDSIVAPRFHMFYGFVAFVTIGLVYSYRAQMRGREELLYGLAGLFIMGLGLRAWLQVR